MKHILGISALYHDSAAVLLKEGDIVAAAQEERFTRLKNDHRFPEQAIDFCLRQAGITPSDLDAIAFYEKPITKFSRMLETYLAIAPRGWRTFPRVMSSWLSEKIQIKQTLGEIFSDPGTNCPIFFAQHHESHAASAFYPSPFEEAAILTIDGVGEWATTTLASGKGKHVEILKEIRFPHSLGLLYSTITAFCGFRVNSGEYKLMGLAPYGKAVYADILREKVIQIHEDGSFHLNLDYFGFLSSDQMDHPRLHALLGGPPRQPDTPMEERFMDIAASIQAITEEIMIKLARHAHAVTGHRNLCLAGGVALNCVGNGKILKEGVFERLWIQPAAGDAGGALGAALAIYHQQNERKSIPPSTPQNIDSMHGALLGPEYDQGSIDRVLQKEGATYQTFTEEAELLSHVASWLDQGLVVGWMQGRMEFGPRALGNRSILGDPRSSTMQSLINRKIKYRESFRPFAPSILQERAEEFFQLQGQASPYMLMVAPTQESIRLPAGDEKHGLERLHALRSTLPAVTHVDDSARVQSVSETTNPLFYRLLKTFEKQTGCPALINTSFNVRGEPIVCSPKDAYDCFMNTEMDILVIGPCVLKKEEQLQQAPKPSFHPVPD
ncbi:MAG: carbamoyltransferase [Limisphaerales bacterium]